MSNLILRHPEEGQLLRYLDGELPDRKAKQTQKHLEACWECRTAVEELEATVTECVRYRKSVLVPCTPQPPMPWRDLDFAGVDAELANRSIFSRLFGFVSPKKNPALGWALSGAAVLALATGIFVQLRHTPKVEAAALLQKAIAVSHSKPVSTRRIQITTRHGRITRAVGRVTQNSSSELEVARLFQAARYDFNDPLSAQSFANWRDQLPKKEDAVVSLKDLYEIKTTTSDSELLSASLTLRTTDLEPVRGRFEFRNDEWVEMTELVDQQTLPASTVAGAAGSMPRQPGLLPGPSASPAAAPEPSPFSEELQVAAALHEMGADLGEPIEITRERGQIVVSGSGIPSSRQQQIHERLDRLPHVAVRFSDPTFPASAPPVQAEPVTRDAAGADKNNRTARIEQRLGGRPQFERVSGQLLDWNDSAMTRAYALRRLAQEFSAEAERSMSAEDRRNLRTMGRSHLDALNKDAQAIAVTFRPILIGIGGTAAAPEAHPAAASWQAASEELLTAARRVETLTAVVLGVTASNTAYDAAPSQLLTAMQQLQQRVEQCRKLLAD